MHACVKSTHYNIIISTIMTLYHTHKYFQYHKIDKYVVVKKISTFTHKFLC